MKCKQKPFINTVRIVKEFFLGVYYTSSFGINKKFYDSLQNKYGIIEFRRSNKYKDSYISIFISF